MALTFADVLRGLANSAPQLVNLYMNAKAYDMEQQRIDNERTYQEQSLGLRKDEIDRQVNQDSLDYNLGLENLDLLKKQTELRKEETEAAKGYYDAGKASRETDKEKMLLEMKQIENIWDLQDEATNLINDLMTVSQDTSKTDQRRDISRKLGVIQSQLKMHGQKTDWLDSRVPLEIAPIETQLAILQFIQQFENVDELEKLMLIPGTTASEIIQKATSMGFKSFDLDEKIERIQNYVTDNLKDEMKEFPEPISVIPKYNDKNKLTGVQKVDDEDFGALYSAYKQQVDRKILELLNHQGISQSNDLFPYFLGMFSAGFQYEYTNERQKNDESENKYNKVNPRSFINRSMQATKNLYNDYGGKPVETMQKGIYGTLPYMQRLAPKYMTKEYE